MILRDIAHGRAGDKGHVSNVSVIARTPALWPIVEREVTADRVAAFLGARAGTEVTRHALPQLHALNFVLRGALGEGGVTRSLALDAHGKCLASVLLGMELEASESDPLPAKRSAPGTIASVQRAEPAPSTRKRPPRT